MKIEELKFILSTEPADVENWDLETWRKEKPMDYLKALSIILQTDNGFVQTEVFKTIYQITRLHVPDVIYKYYSLSSDESLNMKKFQTLSDGKIYMSDIKDFNDPFDGKGFFYDPTKLADLERLKEHGGRYIDDFTRFIRGTCFTSNGVQSMPMWAHYSGNHTGFCVAYDTTINKELSTNVFPVQYTNERLDVTALMRAQAQLISDKIDRSEKLGEKITVLDDFSIIYMALLLYNLKHSSWSYEKEFRCTTASNVDGMPFIEAKPKEIYIGLNCAPFHAQRLIEIGHSWQIPVYQMCFEECSETYELTVGEPL